MNVVSSHADYEKRKALHKNNLSQEGVKFFPKDFEKVQDYMDNAPVNTSVRYKLSSDEGFGRAEYMKNGKNLWQHQESNVSAEIGYALPDKLNIKMIDGKCYLDENKDLEILEIEFFLPTNEKESINPESEKQNKIRELYAEMQKF